MSQDLTLALELEEARAAHAKLVALIEQRMRQLDEMWRTAKPADRLLAVQRLIQTGALAQKVTAELEVRNERVREKMSNARTDRKKLERLVADGAPDTKENLDLRHKVFRLELEALPRRHGQRGHPQAGGRVSRGSRRQPVLAHRVGRLLRSGDGFVPRPAHP